MFDWQLRNHLHVFAGSRLHVFTCIYLHKNGRNRSWPSTETIHKETGLSTSPITDAIKWLYSIEAMFKVPYEKRVAEEKKLAANRAVHQLTGVFRLGEDYIPYMHMTPEAWIGMALELKETGNFLLSEKLNKNSTFYFLNFLDSKNKGITVLNALEDKPITAPAARQSRKPKDPKPKPAPKPTKKPAVKPTEIKAKTKTSKLTPLQKALNTLPPYRECVHQMAELCKKGYAGGMFTPENLTRPELEKYLEAAEAFKAIGGKVEQLADLYDYVDELFPDRDWPIAPMTLVNNFIGYQADIGKPAAQVTVKPVSPIGRNPGMTDEERQNALAKMRADKAKLFAG